jgi:hypothetical protein
LRLHIPMRSRRVVTGQTHDHEPEGHDPDSTGKGFDSCSSSARLKSTPFPSRNIHRSSISSSTCLRGDRETRPVHSVSPRIFSEESSGPIPPGYGTGYRVL